MRREFRSLSPPDAVHETIDSLDLECPTEHVPLEQAAGRVLADRLSAPLDVPGFDRAAMDGYAVVASSTVGASEGNPVTLERGGAVHAGETPPANLNTGEALEIATGAVLPPATDAVIPVERTHEHEDTVEIQSAVAPGDNVMPRGADIASGDRALGPGTRLGPRHIGLLAALGHETVPVRRQPRVAIISTGEELVQPGEPLDSAAGQIYDVNSHAIAAAVRTAGGTPTIYETAGDDYDSLTETLSDAATRADILLTSGSTSAGSTDLLYRVIEQEGEILLHGVSVKPGRPLLVGTVFETPYIGLPGYPVSALTIFRVFVAPRLRAVSGTPESPRATVTASLASRVRYDGGRLRLVPVGLVEDGAGSLVAYAPEKGSGATTTLVETDGIVRMPPEQNMLSPGADVTVERFDPTSPIPSLLGVGEPDPVLWDLLDAVEGSRFLPLNQADADRWVADEVPDIIARAGSEPPSEDSTEPLASWERDWGLLVPAGNPQDIDGCADLTEDGVQLANLSPALSLRNAFDRVLDEQDIDSEAIAGYHRGLPGLTSPAHSVASGRATVGIGLVETATDLGLGSISLGTQQIELRVRPDRQAKAAVSALESAASKKQLDAE